MSEYTEKLDDFACLMDINDWKSSCEFNAFIDYDGFGRLVKDNLMGRYIKPSQYRESTEDATHVLWYNR